MMREKAPEQFGKSQTALVGGDEAQNY